VTPARPTFQYSAQIESRWTPIQSLRQSAERHLAVIAADAGVDSRLHRHCCEVWASWEREALISILHRDYANAEAMLDRGVHVLGHALTLRCKDRLSEDDVVSLIAAA
jgi:hypothetical protein